MMEKHSGDRKKAKKEYMKILDTMSHLFEQEICKSMEQREIPYDQAKKEYYKKFCEN